MLVLHLATIAVAIVIGKGGAALKYPERTVNILPVKLQLVIAGLIARVNKHFLMMLVPNGFRFRNPTIMSEGATARVAPYGAVAVG